MSVSATTAQKKGSVVDAGQAQGRHAEAEQEDDEDAGQAAEDVDVDGGRGADGEEDGAGQAAQDRQHQPPDEDQDLCDQEELDVDAEGVEDVVEALGEDLEVEERRLDAFPARRVDHDERDDGQQHDGAGRRDERPPWHPAVDAGTPRRCARTARGVAVVSRSRPARGPLGHSRTGTPCASVMVAS